MDERVSRFLREKLRAAGRQTAQARRAFREGRALAALSRDDQGRIRIVCRRHAEKRAVPVADGRPACYEAGHPDCEGCVEDCREGVVETW